MSEVLTINGVDFSSYVQEGGISWSRNDIDSKDSGRTTMDGIMHRARIASKVKLQISCMDLNSTQASRILNAIRPVFIDVSYEDPEYGLMARTFYSNSPKVNLQIVYKNGEKLWRGLSFPLIER